MFIKFYLEIFVKSIVKHVYSKGRSPYSCAMHEQVITFNQTKQYFKSNPASPLIVCEAISFALTST